MKKMSHPFLYFVLFLAATSLACSALAGGAAPAATEEVVSEAPINTPAPTQKPTDVPPPTAVPPTAGPQEFFTEEYGTGSDQSSWAYYALGSGDDANLVIEPSDDGLLFDLGDENLYVYYIYDARIYKDIKLTLVAENQGRNNNNVSLVCRFNADEGRWYEGATTASGAGAWALATSHAFSGPNVHATATDAAGNTSEFSSPAPLIASVAPSSTTPGTVQLGVVISGDFFRDNPPLTANFGAGISVTRVQYLNRRQVKAYLDVAPAAAVGGYCTASSIRTSGTGGT